MSRRERRGGYTFNITTIYIFLQRKKCGNCEMMKTFRAKVKAFALQVVYIKKTKKMKNVEKRAERWVVVRRLKRNACRLPRS